MIGILFTTMKVAKWEISRQIKTDLPIVLEEIDLKCIVGRLASVGRRRIESEDLKCWGVCAERRHVRRALNVK